MGAPRVVHDETQDRLYLYAAYEDKDLIRSIEGSMWRHGLKAWSVPVCHNSVAKLRRYFPSIQIPEEILQRAEEERASKDFVASLKKEGWAISKPIKPMPIQTQPFQHQILAYNVALSLGSSALLMEQGTGKTLAAIATMLRRFVDGEINRVLVIAPMSVLPVWKEEVRTHAVPDLDIDLRVLEGLSAKRCKILKEWPGKPDTLSVAVTNYEGAWRIVKDLLAWKPDMVICDESQKIKTPGAAQSKCLHTLGLAAKYRMILTGTPVTQGPLDFFSQYKFLDPTIFGNSFGAFRAKYAVMGGYGNHSVIAYNNLDDLTGKAHAIAFRVTKSQALDLPEQLDQKLYAQMSVNESRSYCGLVTRSQVEINEAGRSMVATTAITQLLRLAQFTGGFLSDDHNEHVYLLCAAKLNLFRETITDLLATQGKKVVVFARFLPELDALRTVLSGMGIGFTWIQGDIPQAERGARVQQFQTDPDCRVFLAQIATAGLGITLHAADTAIFYSLSFSFAEYDQCRSRIHRIGQRNTCTYIHLLVKDTVDDNILRVLGEKKNVADVVVDHWQELLGNPVLLVRGRKPGLSNSGGAPRRISTMIDDDDFEKRLRPYRKDASIELAELAEAEEAL